MKLLAVFVALFSVALAFPASAVTGQVWTLNELSEALQNPSLNPEIKPYLEGALNNLMASLFAGEEHSAIVVAVPAGVPVLIPEVEPVIVEPVIVEPVVVAPAVVEPTPVANPAQPLVQIIVNIDQSASGASPVVLPELVSVDSAPQPSPVHVVEVAPEPVIVAEIAPEPVIVAEIAPEPVIVVETAPVSNPIDTIAVSAPEVNPVDILHPVPAVAGSDVGPLV